MVYPRNPYAPASVNFFGSSSSSSAKNTPSHNTSPHPGLVNLGNTCFLNSVLQAIGGTKEFKLLLQGPEEVLQNEFGQVWDGTDYEWDNRLQSPALRVCDEEHGKFSTSQVQTPQPQAIDGLATVKQLKGAFPQLSNEGPGAAAASEPKHEPTVVDLPLNTALRHTLEKIWGGSPNLRAPNINPKRLLSLLGAKYDQYLEYGQQDGHELMRHLLDACRMEELDLIKKMQRPKPKKRRRAAPINAVGLQPSDVDKGEVITDAITVDEDGSLSIADDVHTEQALAASQEEDDLLPFLDMLFCGKLTSMVVCEGCKKVSHTYEDFYDLSLSLRGEGADPRTKKRHGIRSMADRWRRATQSKPSDKSKHNGDSASRSSTPPPAQVFSETETSDLEGRSGRPDKKKRGSFLSPEEGKGGMFAMRKRSINKKERRADKLGVTSGSEMEPDFPDMASLSLAPRKRLLVADSAPASAGEEDGDARTSTRMAKMLGGTSTASSSRETSPQPPLSGRGVPVNPQSGLNTTPVLRQGPSSHQSAYIARILADDATSSQLPLARRPGMPSLPFSELVAAATAANGKFQDGLYRLGGWGGSGLKKNALSEFETDPNSAAAKRRKQVQEEQSSTGLIAALRQFTSVEVLDGENSFACKNCWRLQNPPNAHERERLRKRKARRGLTDDPDGESEPSSSDGGSESDVEDSISDTKVPVTQLTVPESELEARPETPQKARSEDGKSLSIPIIQMTSPDTPPASTPTPDDSKQLGAKPVNGNGFSLSAPRKDGHGHSTPDSEVSASDSSLTSSTGYETGTETDQSCVTTTSVESDAGDEVTSKKKTRSKPKRSAQSLPRRALKRYLIASAPPVLIFHLKRFQATGRGFVSGLAGFKKIDDMVTFPEYVDITPWLAPPREKYDRKGRLKGTSDPLAIRKRAEEEAKQAGMDAKDVHVEMESRDGRKRKHRGHWGHHHRHRDDNSPGKRHSMWSWSAKEPSTCDSGDHTASPLDSEEVQEGAEVKQGNKEILPAVLQRPKTEYRLYAVVVHQGSLSAGHYTAYVLSDKIKNKGDPSMALAPSLTRSAPPSRVATLAPPNEQKRERRSSAGLAPVPLGLTSPAPEPDDSGITITSETLSSGYEAALSSAGSISSDGGVNPQADSLRPQTSISSMDSSNSSRSKEDAVPARKATRTPPADDGRRWVYCSDTIVRPATIEEVLKSKAYMLFYERV